MIQPVSLPSRLRREIVQVVRLSQQCSEYCNVDKIKNQVVDLACSVLQGSQLTDELDTQFSEMMEEIAIIEQSMSQDLKQVRKIQELNCYVQDIRSTCFISAFMDELQQEKFPLPSYSNLTETVYIANGQLMAESIRLFLESFGIQSILGRESAGVVYGLTVGPLGDVDIYTSHDTSADAKILLDAMQKGYFITEDESDSSVEEDLDKEIPEDEF